MLVRKTFKHINWNKVISRIRSLSLWLQAFLYRKFVKQENENIQTIKHMNWKEGILKESSLFLWFQALIYCSIDSQRLK